MAGFLNSVPEVSIVIPVFNKARYISETLEDVFSQSFHNIEIVIVDDHSTDSSVDVVSNMLEDSPFPYHMICSDFNLGSSGARNLGLSRCKGDFVFFFDADDRMTSSCISRLYDEILASKADLVFCGFESVSIDFSHRKMYLPPRKIKTDKDLRSSVLRKYLMGARWLNASNVMYRKDFISKYDIRFPDGCTFAEDREYILKALFHSKKVSYVDEVLCSYVQHSDQTTKQLASDVSKYAHAVGLYKRLLDYFKKCNGDEYIVNQIREFEIPNSLIKMACSYAENGKRGLFQKLVSLQQFRKQLYPSWKTLYYKPEVAFKAFLALFFPYVLYRKYSHIKSNL